MKKVLFVLSVLFITSCSNDIIKHGAYRKIEEPKNSNKKEYIISSYIRPDFYENYNRIPEENILSNNDLIYFSASPYRNGDIMYQFPDNSVKDVKNVTYLNKYKDRSGVISFSGGGAYANVGEGLLNTTHNPLRTFTFGAWIYVDKWTPGANIFTKGEQAVSLTMGNKESDFIFKMNGKEAMIDAKSFSIGKWHHIAVSYRGNKQPQERVSFYIDGKQVSSANVPNDFPQNFPLNRASVKLGEGLNAKLDEIFFNHLALSEGNIRHFMNNGIALRNTDWSQLKTISYWKFDDTANRGKDEQSWVVMVKEIREKIEASGKKIKLRLGLNTGDSDIWKSMMADENSRKNFALKIAEVLKRDNWDGVDFDFEWCYSQQEFDNYSTAIVETSKQVKAIGGDKIFSVSLHPVSYQISKEAIDAVDFFSFQFYGPSPARFPYSKFVSDAEMITNYGFPKNKTVLGVPFYGTRADGSKKGIEAYYTFVKAGLITSPDLDKVVYKGHEYIFDGQNTIRKEAQYIKDKEYGGLMSWDLATDVSINNPVSLQRVVNEVLGTPNSK